MNTKFIRAALLAAAAAIAGCKSTTSVDPVTYTQAISLGVKNLPPSRPGETYALWFGFPGGVAHSKSNSPKHTGSTKYRLVSRFTMDSYGKINDFDTSGAAARIGYAYAQAEQADISVESDQTINDTLPAAKLMVSDFTGTVHQGIASLSADDEAAIGYTFASLGGGFTLTPSAGSGKGSDVYLMSATTPSDAAASIAVLPTLPAPWKYALWVVDTSATSPKHLFYGTFSDATGHDSDSSGDAFAFPGGRMPSDSTLPSFDLRTGTATVVVMLEPGTLGPKPTLPFGLRLLSGVIPTTQEFFSPASLSNVVKLPTASVIINR